MNRNRRRTFVFLVLLSVAFVLAISLRYLTTDCLFNNDVTSRDEAGQHSAEQRMRQYYNDQVSQLEEDVATADLEMSRRLANVRRVCYRLKASGQLKPFSVDDLKHVIVDDRNRLLYCYVPKVASTNWKRILLILKDASSSNVVNPLDIPANDSHRPQHFRHLDDYSEPEVSRRLRDYLKFVFVRHPFERLLSAYRNKFENSYSDYFRERFGRTIVQRHRHNATVRSLATGDDVTFAEFVEYLLDPRTASDGPLNEHWQSVNDMCQPCHVNYDLVGKYEALDTDARLVLERAGVEHLVQFPKINRTVDTVLLMDDYFVNVTRSNVFRLYQMYALDFKMFGYTYPHVESYNPD